MPVSFPIINGNRYDHSSVEIVVNGIPFKGVPSINYSGELAPGLVYGTSAQPIGRTRGQYKAEGSLSIYREEFADLVAMLALLNPAGGWQEANFLINVAFAELPSSPLQSDKLIGCRITKHETDAQQGGDALVVKCDLSIMTIVTNKALPFGGVIL